MKKITYILAILTMSSCEQNAPKFFSTENDNNLQSFTINTHKDTVLTGEKGTVIKIGANSFTGEDGKEVKGPVKIELKEYYSIEDFINNRLSTITIDGKLLKSSGMILIEAKSGKNNLKIKADQPITLIFPRIQDSHSANLFGGQMENSNYIKWSLLEPVHNDTIILQKETLHRLSYGADSLVITYSFVIGNDTLKLSEENEESFKGLISKSQVVKQPIKATYPSKGDSITNYYIMEGRDERFFVFESTNLGLLNCDIFIEEELYEFNVMLDNSSSDVFIVLDSLNSILYPTSIDAKQNSYSFKLPADINVSIFAYRKDGDKHFYALENIVTRPQQKFLEQLEAPLDQIIESAKKIKRTPANILFHE